MSDATNPWLSRPAAPAPEKPAPPAVRSTSGPTGPQRGIPVPDQVDQLPIRDQTRPAALWWVGVHGGSGESTLAALTPGWDAAEHSWPRVASDEPSRVVLVARSHARGLRAAQAAIRQWAAGLVPSVEVLGLVVVADAPGRLPRALRDLLQVVSGGVPRTWSLPWVESWRVEDPPRPESASRDVQRLVDELASLLDSVPPAPRTER